MFHDVAQAHANKNAAPQLIVASFAVMKLGGIAVMLNPLPPKPAIDFAALLLADKQAAREIST
jgi:acyl-CoA synthetase (AMP-forming)/AMP-acid ligase II